FLTNCRIFAMPPVFQNIRRCWTIINGVAISKHPPQTKTSHDQSVADDKFDGAEENGDEIHDHVSRVYYLWTMRRVAGVSEDGNRLIGSKSALRRTHRNRARTGK